MRGDGGAGSRVICGVNEVINTSFEQCEIFDFMGSAKGTLGGGGTKGVVDTSWERGMLKWGPGLAFLDGESATSWIIRSFPQVS